MTLLVRPGFQFDTDASTYIEAVEAADTQALETATRYAINNFVIGCKQDGIWSAIKASCILAGARTLTGALVPLVGTAPTNVGPFVSGDYNRKTGLQGGSGKHLQSNYTPPLALQNNIHVAAQASSLGTGGYLAGLTFNSLNITLTSTAIRLFSLASDTSFSSASSLGFRGGSRSTSGSFLHRSGGVTSSSSVSSAAITPEQLGVFCRFIAASGGSANGLFDGRLSFYSFGESLDLALLDARVTDLINAFAAAIP